MLKKRSLLMLVLGIVLIGMLVACGDSEDGGGSDGDQVVLDFMHLWPEGSSRQHNHIVRDIVDEFMAENPHVKIEMEILGNEQYKEKLSVIGASNDLPDVGMTWAVSTSQIGDQPLSSSTVQACPFLLKTGRKYLARRLLPVILGPAR